MHKIKKFFCTILQNCKKPIAILKKRCYNSIVVRRQAQNKKLKKIKKIFKNLLTNSNKCGIIKTERERNS